MTDETTQLPEIGFFEQAISSFIINKYPQYSLQSFLREISDCESLRNEFARYVNEALQAKHSKELAAAKEAGAREAIRNMPIKELPSHLRLSDGTILIPSSSAYWDLIESQPKENQGDVG